MRERHWSAMSMPYIAHAMSTESGFGAFVRWRPRRCEREALRFVGPGDDGTFSIYIGRVSDSLVLSDITPTYVCLVSCATLALLGLAQMRVFTVQYAANVSTVEDQSRKRHR